MGDWCYEVPAGGLGPDGEPEEMARLELLEEVGGTATDLCHMGQFYTSNGIPNEGAYVYLATGVACPDCSWSGSWVRQTANRQS